MPKLLLSNVFNRSLSAKFILSLVLANLLVVALFYVVSLRFFQQQLLEFVNREDAARLKPLQTVITQEYSPWLNKNLLRLYWADWIEQSLGIQLRRPPNHPPGMNRHPGAQMRPGERFPGPPHRGQRGFPREVPAGQSQFPQQGLSLPPGQSGPPKRDATNMELQSRLLLLDAKKRRLLGPPDKLPEIFLPIVQDGQLMAYVALAPLKTLPAEVRDLFLAALKRNLGWLALMLAGLNALLAWALSRRFLGPVKQVTAHAHELTAGQFSLRFEHQRRKDELGQLMADMDILANTLTEHRDSQQRWLADIAHELRTPLAVLLGEIEAMQDGIRPLNTSNLASLKQEIQHLQALVEDLRTLTLSDMGALKYDLLELDLLELCEDVADGFEPQYHAKGLEIEVSADVGEAWVLGDATRLRQLLHNLLNNSKNYTDAPGQTRLRLLDKGRYWLLVVEDTAPSVDESKLEKLFDPLYRDEASRNRATGGSGLGLAICRAIVTAHKGKISAKKSDLGGIKVEIEIAKEQP